MEMKDFEVGKKYKHPTWKGTVPLTCVGFTTTGVPIMECGSHDDIHKITAWNDWKNFVEYREPREFWMTEERGTMFVWSSREWCEKNNPPEKIIHVREVIE